MLVAFLISFCCEEEHDKTKDGFTADNKTKTIMCI